MVDKDRMEGSAENDVILYATCKRNTAFLWLDLLSAAAMGICALVNWTLGNYFASIPFGMASLLALVYSLDLLFSGVVIFYRDRVVKDWYLLGRRTIFYGRLQVAGPSGGGWWGPKVYEIRTVIENGRPYFVQFPIWIYGSQFSAETMAKIDAVMEYLKECTQQGPSAAESCTLTRDVLYRNKVGA